MNNKSPLTDSDLRMLALLAGIMLAILTIVLNVVGDDLATITSMGLASIAFILLGK